MKKDIKLNQQNGYFDIAVENGDFANEDGFDTAIWVSLFTDARATLSQVLLPEKRRGWLGNITFDEQLGGFLWLVEQRRLTQDTLNETVDYARKSLNYLVDDNIVSKIEVEGEIVPKRGIAITILITTLDGSTSQHYVEMWKYTGN